MKFKQKAIPIFFFLVWAGWVPVYAQTAEAPAEDYTWPDKLKRGALNMVSSPVEIARQIQMTSEEDSLLEGWTLGLIKGLGIGALRFGAGLIDVVTFPFDFPDEDKAPLIQPEYVWEKPGVKYT